MGNEIKFTYAKELKKQFKVQAHFYNLELKGKIFECRSVLEILSVKTDQKVPDVVVVMMNPGSSKPLDSNYKPTTYTKEDLFKQLKKSLVPTQPDNAQYQIMRLAQLNGWNFVRILNLSDLRDGDSGKFKQLYTKAEQIDNDSPHCITHFARRQELNNALKNKNKAIIVAWGSVKELEVSANEILNLDFKIIGLVNKKLPYYRYASPRLKNQKTDWLRDIQKEIQKNI